MNALTTQEIQEVIRLHSLWTKDDLQGECASLQGADLREADLREADLRKANLQGANLQGANLCKADLQEANLREANLQNSNLCEANLYEANLWRADLQKSNLWRVDLCEVSLREANLQGANLCKANLQWADLRDTNLWQANLWGANLQYTCLDPDLFPNANTDGFTVDGDHIIGYRTRNARHIDKYRDGQAYNADWFSVADTECHPGLYVWPTIDDTRGWSPQVELIAVRIHPKDLHKAGNKWRCRGFVVIGRS